MEKLILLMLLFVSCGSKYKQELQKENILSGTKWECKIAEGCINSYKFNSDSSFIFYSCEMEDEYFGNYYFKKDTLFIDQKGSSYDTELPEESTERKLYALVIKDNKLKHLSVSDWVKGKWVKSDFKFDDSYLYKKVNQ